MSFLVITKPYFLDDVANSEGKDDRAFDETSQSADSGHKFVSVEDEILTTSVKEEEALVKVVRPIDDDLRARLLIQQQMEEVNLVKFCILFLFLIYLFYNVSNYC